MNKNNLIIKIKQTISNVCEIPFEELSEEENLLGIGITSLEAVKVINILKDYYNIDISAALIFQYQTIKELANFISNNY